MKQKESKQRDLIKQKKSKQRDLIKQKNMKQKTKSKSKIFDHKKKSKINHKDLKMFSINKLKNQINKLKVKKYVRFKYRVSTTICVMTKVKKCYC